MKKQLKLIVLLVLIASILLPARVNAKEYSNNNNVNVVSNYVQIAADKVSDVEKMDDGFGNNQSCNSLLGNPKDEKSVAWLLVTILNYMRVLGPLIVVVLSGIEFTKTIVQSDDDAMKKAKNHLITRLILVGVLFLIPTLTKLLLQIFNVISDPMCGVE